MLNVDGRLAIDGEAIVVVGIVHAGIHEILSVGVVTAVKHRSVRLQGAVQVRIDGISFTVVGIYKEDGMMSGNDFYAPFTTLKTIYGKGYDIDQLQLKSKNLDTEEKNDAFEQAFRKVMGIRHEFDPEDRSALWIWNSASENADMNKAKDILHTSFWILGLLTLLSGIVGVSNIMLIAVKERTYEFGIRLLGIIFCECMDTYYGNQTMDMGFFQSSIFVDPTVDVNTCIHATIVMIIAGALAGFFPASKAANVKPIEALRG